MRQLAVVPVVVALIAGPATSAAQDINTTPEWDGSSYTCCFGEPRLATFGQTLTVGAETYLNSFSFWLANGGGGANVVFGAYLMAWDGYRATGPILWQSSSPHVGTSSDGMIRYDFFTGSLALASSQQYVAFMSTSNYQDGITGEMRVGAVGDLYAGGKRYGWTTARTSID